jgi:ATP-dependent Clp protease ATP-binding subunit ClpX
MKDHLPQVEITLDDWNQTDFAKTLARRKLPLPLSEIQEALDKRVVGQEEAKKKVAEAVYYHKLRIDLDLPLPKGNVLMIGPSGSGKTFMMEVLGEKLKLPVAILDASKMTREGAAGAKLEDAIVKLLEQTNGDVNLASQGIIVLDEFDKQLEDLHSFIRVTGESVQNQLLRLMQGDQVTVPFRGRKVTVDTSRILFTLAGSFLKFSQLYKKEVGEEELLSCGLRPEFLGRIGYVAQLNPLGRAELRQYLTQTGEGSPLEPWRSAFEKRGLVFHLSDQEIDSLIEGSLSKQTGIRGLQNSLRQLLMPRLITSIR